MPLKTIVTTITVGVHDPDLDHPEVRDAVGTLLTPASRGLRHAAPGTPVTLDADEADRIIARWGGRVVPEVSDEDGGDLDEEDGTDADEEDGTDEEVGADDPAPAPRKTRR